MTCIEKHILQKYIDNECTKEEMGMVKKHLSFCSACQKKHSEMTMLSIGMKEAIQSLEIAEFEIPEFKNTRTRLLNRNIRFIIYSLSAACIILFMLFFVDKKSDATQRQITIVQSIPSEIDANRPASDQDFVIEVYDGKGQRSEYRIE